MPQRSLRLWPGVAFAIALAFLTYLAPRLASRLAPDAELFGLPLAMLAMIGGAAAALAIFIWWMLFSRAPWLHRASATLLIAGALGLLRFAVHESIAGAGQGMLLYFSALPGLALALVIWAVISRHASGARRWGTLTLIVMIACTPWALMRTAGIRGGAGSEFHWRWTPTPEERLLAQAGDEPKPPQPATPPESPVPAPLPIPTETMKAPATTVPEVAPARPAPTEPASREAGAATAANKGEVDAAPIERGTERVEWPGFRGLHRDGIIRGVRIKTDWTASPPVEMWRRPVGPGWSSFAVHGEVIFTQEQRGEDEIVSAYRLSTGEPVWRHRDTARFYESNGGPGPRATPTISRGRVFTFGATGILNALDERTGAVVWKHDMAAATETGTPFWGFSGSPIVVGDLVIANASGTIAAYDVVSGTPRWVNPSRGGTYGSVHRVTLDGVDQILLLGGPGAMSVTPATGALLWEHKWEGSSIAQPAVLSDTEIVISALGTAAGAGIRRLSVTQQAGAWTVDERWTSIFLKPYFNDFVLHEGYAFGFDGSILSCVDLQDGKRVWKGGRYGNGQLILLPEQDVLLVISEEGELKLVAATPEKFTEIAQFPALNSKTWNHPVIVGDVLLVRNGEEMAAFRLPLAGAATTTR